MESLGMEFWEAWLDDAFFILHIPHTDGKARGYLSYYFSLGYSPKEAASKYSEVLKG